MEKHEQLREWALGQGVKLNGVAAHRFPGRGLGIIATEKAQAGKVLISVPTSALGTRFTVSKGISSKLPGITTHGLLAADLALDISNLSSPRSKWNAVLPSRQDFEESLPFLWPANLQCYLPPAAATLLKGQQAKFKADWDLVSQSGLTLELSHYQYAWVLVNTRTFYYNPHPPKASNHISKKARLHPSSTTKVNKPIDPNEHMALNPFADYFNHSSRGCLVEFSRLGFEITADRTYELGEEVYISYGKHGNDFLLAEYGFVMDMNVWDDVCLDEVVLGRLGEEQKRSLGENHFLGKYVLDKEGICYRTEVALRCMVMPERRWFQFVGGMISGDGDKAKVDELADKLLGELKADAQGKVEALQAMEDKEHPQRIDMLIKRWKQILKMIIHTTGPEVVIEI